MQPDLAFDAGYANLHVDNSLPAVGVLLFWAIVHGLRTYFNHKNSAANNLISQATAYAAQGNITFTAIGRSYQMLTGFLTRYKPMADAKKVLQPRKFRITWQEVIPVPIGSAG